MAGVYLELIFEPDNVAKFSDKMTLEIALLCALFS
jgi:hypothetical protein